MGARFNRAAILGVGLIGGSLALALKGKGLAGRVCGWGRTVGNLRRALERGIIDEYETDALRAVAGADLVVLATPPAMFADLARAIAPALAKGALVMDVGSVKGRLVRELESLMPESVHFIGSHPIAGGERPGIDDARADLFEGARCIITPTSISDAGALARTRSVWSAAGAVVEEMDAERHDALYALMSHLPHMAAYALVNTVDGLDAGAIVHSGGGFRDTTRIAMSSPEMWRDIALLNREHILSVLRAYLGSLGRIGDALERSDAAALEAEFRRARELRMKLNREQE